MKLRNYQKKAVEAAARSLQYNPRDPCVVAPTASGKSVIMAFLIKELVQQNPAIRILILAHVKELILQNTETSRLINPSLKIGIYSAGLGIKDKKKQITFSTIISAWNAVKDTVPNDSHLGHIDLIIVDEAHHINIEDEGVYRRFIALYKSYCGTKVIGFTATPYRTSTGSIIHDNGILKTICYEIKIPHLINCGYIARPFTISAKHHAIMENVAIKNGEFDATESTKAMLSIGKSGIEEMIIRCKNKNHIICFCCNIEHAENVCAKLNNIGISSVVLHSKLKNTRDQVIEDFKSGKVRCLVNVNILTEGFDAPFIDCVILMRATMSPGLYVQMIGRGFRITPDKKTFLVLDYGENIERHGCIDDIKTTPFKITKKGNAPIKICPECRTAINIAKKDCPSCGYIYEQAEKSNVTNIASIQDILSYDAKPVIAKVRNVKYYIHQKVGKPDSMRVIYYTGNLGLTEYSEYICLNHEGFAQQKALEWWYDRYPDDPPESIEKAIEIAKTFEKPTEITVKRDGKYWRIVDYIFESKATKKLDIFGDCDPDADIDF